MKFLTLLSLLVCLSAQKKIVMSDLPSNKGAVKLEKIHTFDGGEDGYYNKVQLSHASNGKYIITDLGNKKIFIHSENFDQELSFGKEGNGPGEFSSHFNVVPVANRIYLATPQKVMSFTYEGRFINEAKIKFFGQFNLVFSDEGFYFESRKGAYKKYSYDKDATMLEKRQGKDKLEASGPSHGTSIYFKLPSKWKNLEYDIQHKRGEYQLSFQSKEKNEQVFEVTRPFTRIKRKPISKFRIVDGKKVRKTQKTLNREYSYRKRVGEYNSDIISVLGEKDGFVFVLVASETKEARIVDVISPEYKFYDQIIIKNKDIQNIKLQHGKLLLICKNDDIGPYAEVYDVHIN